MKSCEVCGQPLRSRGSKRFCSRACYWKSDFPTRPLADRFWEKVDKQPSGCWVWTGSITKGYGQICVRTGRPELAHRVAYQLLRGDIPIGLELDHLCRNRACVNPGHLEVVDNRTNCLRGIGPTAINARMTHCKRGHELNGSNVNVYRGMRFCRACAHLRYEAKKRAHS